jgi:hypothetical protein
MIEVIDDMDAENYRYMKSLNLGVDIERYPLGGNLVFEAATRNGMHEVWFALKGKEDEFVGDGRDHPFADEIRQRLKKACMDYDGRDHKLDRYSQGREGRSPKNEAEVETTAQTDLAPPHQVDPVDGVFSAETPASRKLGPKPSRRLLHHYTA